MKSLQALLVIALLSFLATGCGKADKSIGSTASSAKTVDSAQPKAPDGSASGSQGVDPDHDDHITEDYGHAALAADTRTLTTIIKRYYAAAAAGDGGVACSMIFSSLAKAIPTDYGQSAGPPALRGKTCQVVLSKLFKQQHQLLSREAATMVVRKVRVSGNHALAFLAFKTTPEPRDIGLNREGGTWKISGLLDSPLP